MFEGNKCFPSPKRIFVLLKKWKNKQRGWRIRLMYRYCKSLHPSMGREKIRWIKSAHPSGKGGCD
jgi:hypothetical protein